MCAILFGLLILSGKEDCMKKLIAVLLAMLLLGTSLSVTARVDNEQYAKECIQFLEKCGLPLKNGRPRFHNWGNQNQSP